MLARVVPQLTNLMELDLSGCNLGDKGASTVAAAGLPPSLTALLLADNGISAGCFGRCPPIRGRKPPGPGGAGRRPPPPPGGPPPPPPPPAGGPPPPPPADPSAEQVLEQVVGPLTAALLKLAALRRLVLSSNAAVGDQGAEAIAGLLLTQLPALSHLELRGCGVGDNGLKALAAVLSTPQCAVCTIDLVSSHGP